MYCDTGDAIPRMLTTIVTTGGQASHNHAYDQRRSIGCRAAPAAGEKNSGDRTRQPLVDGCPAREEEMSLVCYFMVGTSLSTSPLAYYSLRFGFVCLGRWPTIREFRRAKPLIALARLTVAILAPRGEN
jgi:hypothetical protein